MDREDNNRKNQGWQRVRAIQHIGMGGVYLVVGGLVLSAKRFGLVALSGVFAYVLGSVMLLYGAFRIWRGFKDLNTKDR